jgi:hypothetical protein
MIEQQLDAIASDDLMSIIAQEVKNESGLFTAKKLTPGLVQYDIGSSAGIYEIRDMLINLDPQALEEAYGEGCNPNGHGQLGLDLCTEIQAAMAEHKARKSDMEEPP